MSNPEIKFIQEKTWTKILSNVTVLSIKRLSSNVSYFITYRPFGDETPLTDNEKYKIFEQSNNYTDEFIYPVDIYMWWENHDDDNNDTGIIRIDYAVNNGNHNVLSFSKNGIISTSYADDGITKGQGFQIHRIIPIPVVGIKFVADFSAIDLEDVIFTLPLRMTTNKGQIYVKIY